MPYVETADATRIAYTDWPGREPVVFAHAWGLTGDMWSYQVPDLTDAGLRCVTYDRRGHGRSDRPGQGYDFDTLADDLAAVIQALDLTGVTLVGHSLGAAEVVRYLSRHGSGRVARLVLSAPSMFLRATPDNPGGLDDTVLRAGRELMGRDLGAWIDQASDVGPYFGEGEAPAHAMDWTRRQIMDVPVQILVRMNLALTDTDFRSELAAVDVPTLVIHGSADFSAPLDLTGRQVAGLVPGSELVVIEGAGHGLYQSYAPRYNAELMRFRAA